MHLKMLSAKMAAIVARGKWVKIRNDECEVYGTSDWWIIRQESGLKQKIPLVVNTFNQNKMASILHTTFSITLLPRFFLLKFQLNYCMQHIHHLWHKKRFSNYGQISFGTHFNVSFYSTWLQHPSFGLYHCIPYCRKFFIDHCINGILIRNRHQLSWWLGNGYKIINKMNTQICYISIFSWNSMARPL